MADPMAMAVDMNTAQDRRKGYLITLLGVFWLSPDALVLRLIDTDAFSIIAYRGGLAVITLCIFLAWRDGRDALNRFLRGGWPMLLIGVLYAINSAAFVYAIEKTSVADVLVIVAATPLVAAILGWLLLGEIPSKIIATAIALGGIGVAISTIGGISGGNTIGIIAAIITTALLATQFTLLRYWPQVDNVAAIITGSAIMGLMGLTLGDPFALEGIPLVLALCLGLFLSPIAYTLVTVGPRYLSSAEVSLTMLLETALGPLWVWLVLREEPPATALIGGALIVGAVVIASGSAFRSSK